MAELVEQNGAGTLRMWRGRRGGGLSL